MDLDLEFERLKLELLRKYEALVEAGKLSEEDFDKVIELIDELEDLSPEEFSARIEKIGHLRG